MGFTRRDRRPRLSAKLYLGNIFGKCAAVPFLEERKRRYKNENRQSTVSQKVLCPFTVHRKVREYSPSWYDKILPAQSKLRWEYPADQAHNCCTPAENNAIHLPLLFASDRDPPAGRVFFETYHHQRNYMIQQNAVLTFTANCGNIFSERLAVS